MQLKKKFITTIARVEVKLKHIIKKKSANESFFKINPTKCWIL